jgi:hypothetical protein
METTSMELSTQEVMHNSIEVFKTAPEILKANQDRSEKAVIVGNNIMSAWQQAWSIEDESTRLQELEKVDARSNDYLINSAKALTSFKEARAPITQLMDTFKSMFTEAEKELDKKNKGVVTERVQLERNKYVTELAAINKRKEEEAAKVLAKKQETIDISAQAQRAYNNAIINEKTRIKNELLTSFNALKFEGFADAAANLRLALSELNFKYFVEQVKVSAVLSYKHHLLDEVKKIVTAVRSEILANDELLNIEDVKQYHSDLCDKISGKYEELKADEELRKKQAAAAAAAAAAKDEASKKEAAEKAETLRLQAEKAEAEKIQREKEEAEKVAMEAAKASAQAETNLNVKVQGEQTMAMFEQQVEIADNTEGPAVRGGYEIEILHPVGFTQIFAIWFEKVGKDLPIDKLGNTKLEQMKAWAEKEAHKNNSKIDSKFLTYKEVFKAVNAKTKA